MSTTIQIKARGQITLPSKVRKDLGLAEGSFLTLEAVDGKLVLTPARTVEYKIYSDQEIAQYVSENTFTDEQWALYEEKLKRREQGR